MTPTDFLMKQGIKAEENKTLIELLQDYYSEKTQDLQVERARLASKVLDKSLLIQSQSDKIKDLQNEIKNAKIRKEFEEDANDLIVVNQESMKEIERIRKERNKLTSIITFFDIRMKGNELYEQVKNEIKGGKEC